MLSHQIILHPDTPFTSSFTPYERKVGFSWYLCPATVAGEQEWLLVNVEFGYVELLGDNIRAASDIEHAVLDIIERHLPDEHVQDNVSVSWNPNQITWHTADKITPFVGSRYQQALALLDECRDITAAEDALEHLNDTQLTISGRTFAPAEGLDGLLLELADNYRHYIDSTAWYKQQWDLLTGKRPWLD
jgi:hypothetical protein